MFKMLASLWAALTVLINGLEQFALSFNDIGTVAHLSTGGMVDEARITAMAQRTKLLSKHGITEEQLALATPVVKED